MDYFRGKLDHLMVILQKPFFLFGKFPGIIKNGDNFIIVVTSETNP